MLKLKGFILFALITIVLTIFDLTTSFGYPTTDNEWAEYKKLYGKNYSNSPIPESYARYFYSYNKGLIENHNFYYKRGLRTFGLRINQFTDMRLISFNSLFPESIWPSESFNSTLPPVDMNTTLLNSFDPVSDLGFNLTIEDQGQKCNSGWAYATAKSVELLNAYQSGIMQNASLSAQNLIDCAGQSIGCTCQVSQTGFDYMVKYKQELYFTTEYPNKNNQSEQGMCIFPQMPPKTVTLKEYGIINDCDDETMKRYVSAQYPVVIEFNPTSFEFMHYGEGIFQQPYTSRGSHFMTVIGYGLNETLNLNYFIVQNSFGKNWGEEGLIKIAYSNAKPLAKSAILPIS